jgi:hypothetical protein
MDVILVMPSKEDRKANRDTPEQWAYEVMVVETVKDMVKKLSAKRPSCVFVDSEMISKLREKDLKNVAKEYSVTLLPRAEHHRIVKEVRAGDMGRARKARSVAAMKTNKFRTTVRAKLNHHQLMQSIIAKSQADRHSQRIDPPSILLPELHDPANGRIDAKKIADRLAMPLSKLSDPLGVDYGTVYKTPSAERLQPALRPIKRSLEILSQTIGNQKTVLAWLNTPHPFLDKKTPLQIIQDGQADQLETILENAIAGIPY